MNFKYSLTEILVKEQRLEKPPRMDELNYRLRIYSKDVNLTISLLKKI